MVWREERSRQTLATLAATIVIGVLSSPDIAQAEQGQDDVESRRAQARSHAQQAQTHYELGRFEEALREYETAYEILPSPAVLFNLGQCHRQMGRHDRAVFFFENYLHEIPDAPNRADVEELIQLSRSEHERQESRQGGERETVDEPRTPDETVEPTERNAETERHEQADAGDETPLEGDGTVERRRPIHRRWWFWTILGTIVIGASVGIALWLTWDEPQPVLPQGTIGLLDGREP